MFQKVLSNFLFSSVLTLYNMTWADNTMFLPKWSKIQATLSHTSESEDYSTFMRVLRGLTCVSGICLK